MTFNTHLLRAPNLRRWFYFTNAVVKSAFMFQERQITFGTLEYSVPQPLHSIQLYLLNKRN